MAHAWVLAAVLSSFRSTVLADSERDVPFDQPLGGIGFGLDSLALVEFLTAIEKRFETELPESAWTTRENLTLRAIVELVEKEVGRELVFSGASTAPQDFSASSGPGDSRMLRGGGDHPLWRRIRKLPAVLHRVYETRSYRVLSFDLEKPIPSPAPPLPLLIRTAHREDEKALGELYSGSMLRAKTRTFAERLRRGYVCLTAWYEGRLVGIDWIAPAVHSDSMTGLEYQLDEGTCCGVDLYEQPSYQRQGIGLSLLIASLVEAKRLAFRRQTTIVEATNLRMLSATTHLLGFEHIGRIQTARVFGRPRSTWVIGARSGHTRCVSF